MSNHFWNTEALVRNAVLDVYAEPIRSSEVGQVTSTEGLENKDAFLKSCDISRESASIDSNQYAYG